MRPGPAGEFGRVSIRAFGRPWVLADVPAVDWILAASEPDLAGIFPGLVDEGDMREAARLFIGPGRRPDAEVRATRASRVALERAGRREWFWAYNLIQECLGGWTQVNGMLVRQGVRAQSEPLPDWLDSAYTLCMELYQDKKERTAFQSRLTRIPKDALGTVKPRFSSREDLLAFAAP